MIHYHRGIQFTTVNFSSETMGARRKVQNFSSARKKGMQTVNFISDKIITHE